MLIGNKIKFRGVPKHIGCMGSILDYTIGMLKWTGIVGSILTILELYLIVLEMYICYIK
jgi:hypothetical protein